MNTVEDVSRILRRKCPSERDIVESSKDLKDHTDSLWLMEGEDDPNKDHEGWKRPDENLATGRKRRKVSVEEFRGDQPQFDDQHHPTRTERAALLKSTTMENHAIFSGRSSGGFTSAASQLHCITEAGFETQQTKSSRVRSRLQPGRLGALHGGANANFGAKLKDKSNLLSLWVTKSTQSHLSHSNAGSCPDSKEYHYAGAQLRKDQVLPKRESRKYSDPTHDQTRAIHTKRPLNVIPPGLANHKLYSRPPQIQYRANENDQTPKHYLFLSSSPPPTNDLASEQTLLDDEVGATYCTKATLTKSLLGGETSGGNMRPASTFHTTSVAEVKAGANHSKKTLGIRRSMTGWSSRGNQRFSIPGKAQKGI